MPCGVPNMAVKIPRVLRALALAALLGATGVAAAGFFGDAYGSVPGTWELPPLEYGASGEYAVQGFNRTPGGEFVPIGPTARGLEYRNPAPEWILDASGQPRLASGVESTIYGYVDRTVDFDDAEPTWAPKWTMRVLEADGDTVATQISMAFASADRNESLVEAAGQPLVSHIARGTRNVTATTYADASPPAFRTCGLVNPYQGSRAPLGRTVDLGNCLIAATHSLGSAQGGNGTVAGALLVVARPFDIKGTQAIDGERALALETSTTIHGARVVVRLWLTQESPVPVRMVTIADDWAVVLSLAGTHQAAPDRPGPAPEAAPGLTWAPRQPWGPDDSDADHFFPASQAWAAAMEDARVAAYFDAHPKAVAARMHGTEHEFTDRQRVTWQFRVTDGMEPFVFSVDVDERPLLGMYLEEHTGIPDPAWDPDVEVTIHEQDYAPLPPPETLPDVLPTVGSIAKLRASYSGVDGASPEWEFTAECQDLPCVRSEWLVAASRKAVNQTIEPHATQGHVQIDTASKSSTFNVHGDGHRSLFVSDGSSRSQVAPSPLAAGRAPSAPAAEAPAWSPPSVAVAAATGLAALVAGLLYYLWPQVKAVGIGLFSRMGQQEIVDHPVRRHLLAAVEADPGIHFQELVRRVGVGRSSVDHHLRHLESRGLIVRRLTQGYACFAPRGTDRRVLAGAGAIRSSGARAVLAAIEAAPGASIADTARATGLERSTAHHHVQRLTEAGLVERRRDGRAVRLWRVRPA